MPNVNWNALNSLSRAKIGQSHPIKDSPFSNPAVQQIARDERVNSLANVNLSPKPPLVDPNAVLESVGEVAKAAQIGRASWRERV